jgi:nitronate monooxygenase/enoyl-[acyl-carrier protein] reductase II
MVQTPLCELLGIAFPIIQAPLGPWSSVGLVAAVSNAGGLGSLGTALRTASEISAQIAALRQLTTRPFAVNHTLRPFNEEVFAATLQARPPIISFALGDPAELVQRAHDAGILFLQQVTTVQQARQAAERGVDVISAQGSEAGGFGGTVSTFALVPQVVDAVSPIPVVASGGIADGRGLAAALLLGAQGISIGTRFVASREATVDERWKQAIVAAESEEAIKVSFANDLIPPSPGGYDALPRALRTPFIEEWQRRPDDFAREVARLRLDILAAIQQGRGQDELPFTGQTAGLIHDVLPADTLVRRIVAEAEEALERATSRFRVNRSGGVSVAEGAEHATHTVD